MASSNRHWPSMFKSKPCNTAAQLQWQHDVMNSPLISAGLHRTPNAPVPGCEERTPEPKPRWNPRPEQIRILEAIFNSGMVNPPRDEIRKIRSQLLEYGQVGDANVFYWFQNRKSRSKHKQRHLHSIVKSQPQTPARSPISNCITSTVATTIPTSSSSSSDKRSAEKTLSVGSPSLIDLLHSPTTSVNQPFFQASRDFLTKPVYSPVQQSNGGPAAAAALTQGFCFPDFTTVADQTIGSNVNPCFLLNELMLMSDCSSRKAAEDDHVKMLQQLSYSTLPATPNSAHSDFMPSLNIPSSADRIIQGVDEMGPARATVFINDVCFEIGVGLFNVREAFGDDAMLMQSSGRAVAVNEWGITLQPLQNGEFYYLLRCSFTPPLDQETTNPLI